MDTLAVRLLQLRQDIAAFTLTVHELSAGEEPLRSDLRIFTAATPDRPGLATAILHPELAHETGTEFDPLEYVQQAADAIIARQGPVSGSFSAPMPPYSVEGKPVHRRFDCSITFVGEPHPILLPDGTSRPAEPPTGCC